MDIEERKAKERVEWHKENPSIVVIEVKIVGILLLGIEINSLNRSKKYKKKLGFYLKKREVKEGIYHHTLDIFNIQST